MRRTYVAQADARFGGHDLVQNLFSLLLFLLVLEDDHKEGAACEAIKENMSPVRGEHTCEEICDGSDDC